MLRMVARDSRRARTMPRRSPLTRVIPALSMATSVPVPIAMPTSAAARAGASLTPSPAMATTWPSACRRRTTSAFCSGSTSATTSSRPRERATACAVTRLSPVSMITRSPSACSRRIASGVLGLIGSATPSRPTASSPTTRNITVWPSARRASTRAASCPASTPSSWSRRGLPRATCLPATVPITPRPVSERKSVTSAGDTPRSAAPARIAAASGCSLPRSRPATSASIWVSGIPSAAMTETSRGLPSVSVPVLSTTKVSTFSIVSSASALLMSTPACAPRPVATMIEMGVANPSAHGQAMISTATALTSA